MKHILSALALCLVFSVSTFAQSSDTEACKTTLNAYKQAIEKLDSKGMSDFFTTDAQVFESGGVEGTFAHYLEHHLGPELKEFKSFTFKDYKVEVRVEGRFAFAVETYKYDIVLKSKPETIARKGVATSILQKTEMGWKILQTHSSSRKP
ncbi:MAG: nuclear transport factor 2 family protein [Candidatus Kapabacteria bacterium]|jgi:ketosteroid isomerase-like protein|nr:nuclear transport factor 2 family protein [Candidatus Kapabacteria bacterium]